MVRRERRGTQIDRMEDNPLGPLLGAGSGVLLGAFLMAEAPVVAAIVPRDRLTHRGRSQTFSCRCCLVAGSTDLSDCEHFTMTG